MWKVEGGAASPVPPLDAHQERHGGVQEVVQRRGNNGQVDVLPLEREEQGGHALRHRHQTLVVWGDETELPRKNLLQGPAD